jgi:excisionase family DNA binding protein
MPRRRKEPTGEGWITAKQAADHIGVGVDTVYDACARRGLRHVRVGGSTIRLKLEWLETWLERQAVVNA